MLKSIGQRFELNSHEARVVLLSACYFFLLLCSYYILRPIRESIGISRNPEDLPYLFLATMAVLLILSPIIGGLVSRYQRSQFIPIAYRFVAVNLLVFFLVFKWIGPQYVFHVGVVFYIWLSVINLLLVSLFWGFMSDGISFEQSKRLFPGIAIGGTLGAIFGSTIAQQLVQLLGQTNLLLFAVVLLECAVLMVKKIDACFKLFPNPTQLHSEALSNWNEPQHKPVSRFTQWTSGIRFAFNSPYMMGIAGYIFFYGITSTFLYFHQGILVANETEINHERVEIFASIDLIANMLTLMIQLFITHRLLKKFGIGVILIGLPILILSGFIALWIAPTLITLVVFQTLRRATNYGLFKPARETLFTLLPQQQKYKAKSFVDTFVYRGGDAIAAASQKLLVAFQLGVGSIALIIVPIAAVWSLLAYYLGRKAKQVSENKEVEPNVRQ